MKYKHKTTGEEAVLIKAHLGFYNVGGEVIPKRFIEDSCDWEKVEELDYEILSFFNEDNREIYRKTKGSSYEYFNSFRQLTYCLSYYNIHSVKRLSDGEIFTIGDTLNFNDIGKGKLLRIDFERAPVDKGTGRLCFVNDNIYLGDWWRIKELSKVKTPLFTTTDGVNIYEGTRYYLVSNDFVLGYCSSFSQGDLSFKCFAKKENAEKYIEENKKVYSLNDIRKVLLDDIVVPDYVVEEVLRYLNK